jgi:hypothetical protein
MQRIHYTVEEEQQMDLKGSGKVTTAFKLKSFIVD